MNSDQTALFLIRVWKDNQDKCAGQIEDIQNGEKVNFAGLENLQITMENLLEEKSKEINKHFF